MKLIFFVIAVCLVSIRVYFSWSGKEEPNANKGNILITSNDFEERIRWLGEIRLNEAETAIEGISPGGYVKYARNDTQVVAESNVSGAIDYSFPGMTGLTEQGKAAIVRQAAEELVGYGLNAQARMERLYQQGGYPALISGFNKLKLDHLQVMYMNRIFAMDSLRTADLVSLTAMIQPIGNDDLTSKLLLKFTVSQLDTPAVRTAYFHTIDSMHADVFKQRVLEHLLEQPLAAAVIDDVLASIQRLTADVVKENLYKVLIEKNSPDDKQWEGLLTAAGLLAGDFQKSELLILIAKKMPATEPLRAHYTRIAKTIVSDSEYGKAMRAIN